MMGLRHNDMDDKANVSAESTVAVESIENSDPEDIWAISEGYTPLQDSTLESDAGFLISTSNASTFRTSDHTIFFQTTHEENDDDSDSADCDLIHDDRSPPSIYRAEDTHNPSSNSATDEEYQGIADNALRMLDFDYHNTVQMTEQVQTEIEELPDTFVLRVRDDDNDDTSHLEDTVEEAYTEEPGSLFRADFDQLSLHDDVGTNDPLDAKSSTLINVDPEAVLNAIESIRTKDPKFMRKFEGWDRQYQERRQRSLPEIHPIVPRAPLSAFRNSTAKAIQASARLSRSGTLAEALRRLDILRGSSQNLRIHIVGCDAVESDALQSTFGPIIRWLGNYVECPNAVHFDLIGPNVPQSRSNTAHNLLHCTNSRLQSARLKCHTCLYHDIDNDCTPDLIVAFNAGIWGYDDWIPCLEYIIANDKRIPFVVTAYTIEEAEDDFEVIQSLVNNKYGGDGLNLEWSAESNPFGSQLPRETASAAAGREYRENAAWQAWKL